MKRQSICIIMSLLLCMGCSMSPLTNFAPVLVRTLRDIAVPQNGSITLGMQHVEAFDDNGDEMSLVVGTGKNYTVTGTTIYPEKDFIGDLKVPVQVSDGKVLSGYDTIIVSVVEKLSLFPMVTGSWWEYNDHDYTESTIKTSRLEVVGAETISTGGSSVSAFQIQWANLRDEYGITYLIGKDSTGTVSYGAYAPSDTMIGRQELYHFPVKLNDTWDYAPVFFDATASEFYQDAATKMRCTGTSVYVTVPAGIFECYEFSYLRTVKIVKSAVSALGVTGIQEKFSGSDVIDSIQVLEKIYYASGVGYVQNIVNYNNTVLWKKELRAYSSEEKK